jgi:hypothetical protein
MLIIAISLLVCLVGALVYGLAANPKVQNLGVIAFAVGLFWAVYYAAPRMAHLF